MQKVKRINTSLHMLKVQTNIRTKTLKMNREIKKFKKENEDIKFQDTKNKEQVEN